MTVTATGTLSAVTTVQVGSQVSGVIARLYADFNSQVKKGQLLAELDPTPFQARSSSAGRRHPGAGRRSPTPSIKYDRQQRLVEARPHRAGRGRRRQGALRLGARAGRSRPQASLSQAQTNLALHEDHLADRRHRRRPPVRRRPDRRRVVPGADAVPIAQDLTKMQVQADVDQSDIGRVQGRPDRALHRRRLSGRGVPRPHLPDPLNATVNQNVVTYPVIIEVANPEGRLRPKMTAERHHRRRPRVPQRAARAERRAALQAADGRRRQGAATERGARRRRHAARGAQRQRRRSGRRGGAAAAAARGAAHAPRRRPSTSSARTRS